MARKKQGNAKAKVAQEDIGTKLNKYHELTKKALEKVGLNASNSGEQNAMAKNLLEMARNYFADAQYFEMQGMPLTALAAYSYAHAWIDAGVRLRLLDGKGDDKLFVLPLSG